MYLPRDLISHLYQHLLRRHHTLSPPVLLLVALEPDALCACRILTALLKRDYVPHNIHPISGYGGLAKAGEDLVQPMRTDNGGNGGIVVCLGVGGLVDLSSVLGIDSAHEGEDPSGGVQVWLFDARRPWNLGNVFGGQSDTALRDLHDIAGLRDAKLKDSGVDKGKIQANYRPGKGGVVVYDDGDIEGELATEREAYYELVRMEGIGELDDASDQSETESKVPDSINGTRSSQKRKSWSDQEDDDESEEENARPRQRRRSSSPNENSTPVTTPSHSPPPDIPSTPPNPSTPPTKSPRRLRRKLLKMKRRHTSILQNYYGLGASYSEPISSLLYSLAEDLGRDDNDLLWHAIVGVSSLELYGRSMSGVGISNALEFGGSAGWGGERGERIRQVLRDEVRRLNPPDSDDAKSEMIRGEASGVIPTTARSPADTSIRLSPEPRFLLIRHWSLYESMLHSPYLASRLHIWSDAGRKRLHKLLAKMGVSLSQCKQSYTHMDMDVKRNLRQKLLTYAPMYGLEGLVPPATGSGRGKEGWGFVRSWGWKACLSALDVGVIVGAILEVGKAGIHSSSASKARNQGSENGQTFHEDASVELEEWNQRFWEAYDALDNIEALKHALPIAQHLHRAILRTGTSLIEKRQVRHLSAFRMAVVKEGPDVALFTHPSALTKLALWVGEAIAEQEREKRGKLGKGGKGTPLVLAGLNEARGVYIVVGTGGGGGVINFAARRARKLKLEEKVKAREAKKAEKERIRREREERGDEEEETESEEEESEDDSEDDNVEERGYGRNRFGNAFQEVVDETNARVRIDSFEHCVVEVKKEDLSGFLTALSSKAVVG